MRSTGPFAQIVASTSLLLIGLAAQAQDRSKPEIVPQIPHSFFVSSVAFSPDGRQLLSGSYDHTVKLWDVASGQLVRSFEEHSDTVNSVAFSPDGRQVMSGSEDKTVKLWDVTSGQLVRSFAGHSEGVTSVAFSRPKPSNCTPARSAPPSSWAVKPVHGQQVLSGSWDKTVKLWDAESGQLVRSFAGHSEAVTSVAFSPDGRQLLSGSYDHTVKLWDVASGQLVRSFEEHSDTVRSVAFSPDGRQVLSGSMDGTVKLWDAASGKLARSFEGHSEKVDGGPSVAFSPDCRQVLSGSSDHTVKLWDATNGQLVRSFEGHSRFITSVAFSPDGKHVLSGSWDNTVKLWDAASGELVRSLGGHSAGAKSVAFSPDGRQVLSGSNDKTVKLWDAASGQLLRSFEGHSGTVLSVAFSPNGRQVLSGSFDDTVKLWDTASGQLLRSFGGHSEGVISVAFSPDGRQVLSGSFDDTVKLWDTASGQLLRSFAGHSDGVISMAFSPDGRQVLTVRSYDKTVKLWDAASGQLLRSFEGHSGTVLSVAFSPDGRQVLSGSFDDTVKLWDTASGQLLRSFAGHSDGVISMAFSPDGRQVLSGSYDKTVKLWDAASGQLVRSFEGHSGWVLSVAFSPDGRQVLSGSEDSTIRIWKAEGGELLATLIGSRDGEWLTITSAGFFTGSSGSDKMLAVVRGLESYSVRQFYDQFYRPELVSELLAGDVTGRHKDAAAKLDLEKALNSGPVPTIEVLDKQLDAAGETIQFKVRLYNKHGGGIGRRLIWRLNGNPVGETEPPDLQGKHSSSGPVTVVQGIKIESGRENIVTVTAYNGANLFATEPYVIKIDRFGIQTPHTAPRSRMFIMAIGVNTYEKAAPQLASLDFPVNDVLKLADAFKTVAEDGGYDKPVEIIDLTQEKAVRKTIEDTFADLAKRVRRQDALIVLLSGHGESVAGTYYYYPSDTQLGNGHTIESAGITTETWARWIASVQVDKKLFIVDTCKSWDARAAVKSTDTERIVQEAMANRIQNAVGHSVLTAARDAALESPALGHGVLTYAVLSALGTPNAAKEQIEVKDIDEYVVPEVERISQILGKEQQARNKIDSNFPVGRPNPTIAPPPFRSVQVTPGKYVACGQVIVRSLPSVEDGRVNEVLNEKGGCTEVGVIEFKGSWSKIARAGIERGWVPADTVQKLSK